MLRVRVRSEWSHRQMPGDGARPKSARNVNRSMRHASPTCRTRRTRSRSLHWRQAKPQCASSRLQMVYDDSQAAIFARECTTKMATRGRCERSRFRRFYRLLRVLSLRRNRPKVADLWRRGASRLRSPRACLTAKCQAMERVRRARETSIDRCATHRQLAVRAESNAWEPRNRLVQPPSNRRVRLRPSVRRGSQTRGR